MRNAVITLLIRAHVCLRQRSYPWPSDREVCSFRARSATLEALAVMSCQGPSEAKETDDRAILAKRADAIPGRLSCFLGSLTLFTGKQVTRACRPLCFHSLAGSEANRAG